MLVQEPILPLPSAENRFRLVFNRCILKDIKGSGTAHSVPNLID
jgi:hypothetical protein